MACKISIAMSVFASLASNDVLAQGQPDQGLLKRCILESAEKLPKIPGLVVIASRSEFHADSLKKPSDRFESAIVTATIDVQAAGVEAKITYMCGYKNGASVGASLIDLK